MVFFVPFAALPGYVQHGETLFSAFLTAVVNLPHMQDTGTAGEVAAALIVVITGLVTMLARRVGINPLVSGVLGVCGMGMLTAAPLPDRPVVVLFGFQLRRGILRHLGPFDRRTGDCVCRSGYTNRAQKSS